MLALGLAIGAASGWVEPALACSRAAAPIGPSCGDELVGPVEPGRVAPPAKENTSVAGARLVVEGVEIRRSSYPPPGHGDCGDIGSVLLSVRLTGFDEWPADIGLRVRFAEGSRYFGHQPVAGDGGTRWLWPPNEGVSYMSQPDYPDQPIDATLLLAAVDCAGRETAPVEAHLLDPGRSSDSAPDELGGIEDDAGVPVPRQDAHLPPDEDLAPAPPETRELTCTVAAAPERDPRVGVLVGVLGLAVARRLQRRSCKRMATRREGRMRRAGARVLGDLGRTPHDCEPR